MKTAKQKQKDYITMAIVLAVACLISITGGNFEDVVSRIVSAIFGIGALVFAAMAFRIKPKK